MSNPDLLHDEKNGGTSKVQWSGELSPEGVAADGKLENTNSASSMADMELFNQYLDQEIDFGMPQRGELREGTIVDIQSNEILLNVGLKRDGIIPNTDLQKLEPGVIDALEIGQTITVMVTHSDDSSFIFSISDALQQQDWIDAQALLESGGITTHKCIGYNKGGLTVEYNNLRGFVPASHIMDMPRNLSEEARRAELENRVDTEMRLKVIEVERQRRRLVMSQMLAEREYRQGRKEELFKTLKVGDVVAGVVHGLRPFGAFVDIGGADGLLHVSEIDWSSVAHPNNILKQGEKLDVQIIRLDLEKKQIALSRKRLMPNPWDGIEDRFKVDTIVQAKITRIVDFGAFAQLAPGVEGLIHISEISDISVAEPLKTINSGDEVDVKILRIDPKRQRVGISIRQAVGVLVPDDADEAATDKLPVDLPTSETATEDQVAEQESTENVADNTPEENG